MTHEANSGAETQPLSFEDFRNGLGFELPPVLTFDQFKAESGIVFPQFVEAESPSLPAPEPDNAPVALLDSDTDTVKTTPAKEKPDTLQTPESRENLELTLTELTTYAEEMVSYTDNGFATEDEKAAERVERKNRWDRETLRTLTKPDRTFIAEGGTQPHGHNIADEVLNSLAIGIPDDVPKFDELVLHLTQSVLHTANTMVLGRMHFDENFDKASRGDLAGFVRVGANKAVVIAVGGSRNFLLRDGVLRELNTQRDTNNRFGQKDFEYKDQQVEVVDLQPEDRIILCSKNTDVIFRNKDGAVDLESDDAVKSAAITSTLRWTLHKANEEDPKDRNVQIIDVESAA
jgi:hypothetical protein